MGMARLSPGIFSCKQLAGPRYGQGRLSRKVNNRSTSVRAAFDAIAKATALGMAAAALSYFVVYAFRTAARLKAFETSRTTILTFGLPNL